MILFIEQLASTLCISFEFNLTTILYYSSLIRLLLLILHFVYSILIYKFFRLAESIKCFFQTGMKRTMNQSNYYSAEKISNKDPSLFTKYTFLRGLPHTSLITRRFENIVVDQFSLEFSIGKKIHKRGEKEFRGEQR